MATVYVIVAVEVPEDNFDTSCQVLDDATFTVTNDIGVELETSICGYEETMPTC